MNTKSTSGHQKLMAMAVVAMFAMCAFSVCFVADSDAGPYGGISADETDPQNTVYTTALSTGQTFTYNGIKTNLSDYSGATVTIAGAWESGKAPATSDYSGFVYSAGTGSQGGSLSGSFSKAGSYTYILTATSTHTAGGSSLTQTATQKLNFNVADGISIPTSASGYAIADETASGTQIISIPYAGPAPSSNLQVTLTEDNVASTDFTASFDSGNQNILIKTAKAFSSAQAYSLKLTVKNTESLDSDFTDITVTVFEDIAVVGAGTHHYTYEGADLSDFTFSTSWDGKTDGRTVNTHHLVIASGTGINGANVGSTNPLSGTDDSYTVGVNTSSKTAGTYVGNNLSADFTATLTVTGKIAGKTDTEGNTTPDLITGEATGTYTLTVYKALEFATKPQIDSSVEVTPVSAAGSSVNLSAFIKGANSVVFNWGDGTQTSSMSNRGEVANNYGAFHTYAKPGTYTVTVFATNDHGTTSAQVMYNVGEGDITLPEGTVPADSDKTFFEEHGYQFLIFAILTILLLVAFFFFGIQSPMVILAAIVTAALAVLCFVYNDIGGLIDAVKGILGKA